MTDKATICKLCGAPRDMSLRSVLCSACNAEYFRQLRAKRRENPSAPAEQVCSKCERWLPISSFHRSCAYSSGYNAVCKECVAFYRAMRRRSHHERPASIVCKSCGVAKQPSAFYRSAEGGWRKTCKRCFVKRARARLQWLQAHDPVEYERQQQMSRARTQRSRQRRAAEMFQRVVRS